MQQNKSHTNKKLLLSKNEMLHRDLTIGRSFQNHGLDIHCSNFMHARVFTEDINENFIQWDNLSSI